LSGWCAADAFVLAAPFDWGSIGGGQESLRVGPPRAAATQMADADTGDPGLAGPGVEIDDAAGGCRRRFTAASTPTADLAAVAS
jgi:hypothetical protein